MVAVLALRVQTPHPRQHRLTGPTWAANRVQAQRSRCVTGSFSSPTCGPVTPNRRPPRST